MTHDKEAYREISALMREGHHTDAREKLDQALKEWPDDFWLLRQRAELLIKQGDTQKAGPLLTNLLARRPDHPRLLTLAAERHRLEGRGEEATNTYLASLQLADDGYVRTRAIDGLIALGRFPEAEGLLEEGLRAHPRDAYLLRRKARLLAATARPDEAAATYAQAAKESDGPSNRDYVESLKIRLKPLPAEVQLQEVEQLLKVASHQQNPYLLTLAAELDIDQKKTDRAISLLERAEEVGATDPHLLRLAGFQYNRLEKYERVIDTLGRAFVHEPRDLVSQQVLLAAARKADQLARLRTLFRLAYNQHPGFHKLNGLIKKVENEMTARAARRSTS